MRKHRQKGINRKISILISASIIISIFCISAINFVISRDEINKSNKIILENAIETSLAEINRNYSYTTGEEQWMTQEAAKEASIAAIGLLQDNGTDSVSSATQEETDATSSATENSYMKNHFLNLGEYGYIFIVNSQGDVIYHPFLKDNINNLQSSDGRYIIQDMISLAKSGGGILNYSLKEQDSAVMDGKTVYTKYFPYWDWVVSAVIYDDELASGSNRILVNNLIWGAVILVVSLTLAIGLSSRITKPIRIISEILKEVSDGDLTQQKLHIRSKDETKLLADSVNSLLDNLNRILRSMIHSSDHLEGFAQELSSSSEIVSQATEEVTMSISQMADLTQDQFRKTQDASEEVALLGEYIKEAADTGVRIEAVAQQNLELKEEGLSSVKLLMEANNENLANSSEIEHVIHNINEHSKDIDVITIIITNVAKQTNLLALNASIEAARAGEHGTGFSVVAEEIRKLANETAIATENIRNKIDQMKEQSEEAVKFIEINRVGVEKINHSVQQTQDVMKKTEEGLQQLLQGIQLISNRNMEINHKKNDILEQLESVAKTAEENSASAQQISAAAQEQAATLDRIIYNIAQLHNMSKELNDIINQFKIEQET